MDLWRYPLHGTRPGHPLYLSSFSGNCEISFNSYITYRSEGTPVSLAVQPPEANVCMYFTIDGMFVPGPSLRTPGSPDDLHEGPRDSRFESRNKTYFSETHTKVNFL